MGGVPDSKLSLIHIFLIRIGEEWDQHASDQREYVIQAHNHNGDFEIYKYGLEPDKLKGTISHEGKNYQYQGFSIAQDPFTPWKDYYNPVHQFSGRSLTEKEGANENCHYFADDKNKETESEGGKTYRSDGIEEYYSYGSVSEQSGIAKKVRFGHQSGETSKEEAVYKDARAMQGIQTAYEGLYASKMCIRDRVGGLGLCENFADEYAELAALTGLQCEAYDSDLNHRACLLKIDGHWFRVDPTSSSTFFSNATFCPADYDREKRRASEASKEKWDAYFREHPDSRMEEDFFMMDRLARGEITAEEYNSWAENYYK